MNDFPGSTDAAPHSFAAYLPPAPRPPHDPYTLLLNGRAGWRSQDAMPDALAPRERDGLLTLAPLPVTIVQLIPGFEGYLFFLLPDGRIIIVSPSTLKVVLIIYA